MSHYGDCNACRATRPREQRLAMRCGYLPPAGDEARAWEHPAYVGDRPMTCIGYTKKLPEVIEIMRAHRHWQNGSLAAFCSGEPDELALALIEIFDGVITEVEAYVMTPPEKRAEA